MHIGCVDMRGYAWKSKGDLDRAIEDYDKAVVLDPGNEIALINRGVAWSLRGNSIKAIASFNEAIRTNRYSYRAFLNRGMERAERGELGRAYDDYREAIRLKPDYATAHNNLAWRMAIVSDPQFRDSAQAVEHAEKAVQLTGDPYYRDTLAAAYAAAGRFEDAVREQTRALAEVKAEHRGGVAARLELYKQGKAIYCPGGPECD